MKDYSKIEDDTQQYVDTSFSEKWRFNSKYLKKIHIVVSEGKYKKMKNCPDCSFEEIKDVTMVNKLAHHLQSFHQKELRVNNLRGTNLETEELEKRKETTTNEGDLRELHREKHLTYRLITIEG